MEVQKMEHDWFSWEKSKVLVSYARKDKQGRDHCFSRHVQRVVAQKAKPRDWEMFGDYWLRQY